MLQRMRMVTCSRKRIVKKHEAKFYGKCALLVFNSLKTPRFQKFLKQIFKREKIEKSKIKDIQVRMFPFVKKNGNQLKGKCNTMGEIFLYPNKLDKCKKKMKTLGNEGFKHYIKTRAKAALIHELLHLKYEDNEAKVKELTKKYYTIYSNCYP